MLVKNNEFAQKKKLLPIEENEAQLPYKFENCFNLED